jgi:glycosyltransferase involved in cell wall biosynthesis
MSSLATCVAAPEARRLCEQYQREVAYIPNGIGTEYLPDAVGAQPILARHGLSSGNFLLFVAGRIEPTKGAHLAIEAVNQLPGDIPLLVVGDDSHMPSYGQRLRELAGPRVRFEPLIENRATLFGLMSATRCLIFPSSLEAMSMVLLEAVAMGTPLVCSDIPENREVLQDDATYFESENALALARQLAWVLAHREASQRMSARACERIRSEYAWDTIVERYIQAYEKVCNNHVQSTVRLHRS